MAANFVRTKKIYNEKYAPPAIHPRYQSAFRFLYGTETEENRWGVGSFLVRFLIALFIFLFVFIIDVRRESVVNVDSQTVIAEVRKDLFSQ